MLFKLIRLSLVSVLIAELLVSLDIHVLIELLGLVEGDLDHPAITFSCFIDKLNVVSELLVDLCDGATDGKVDIVGRLNGLDRAERLTLGKGSVLH